MTFVRCDRWISGWRPGTGKLDAARRYLETYAPVRRDELEHWLAQKLPEWDELDLEEVDVEGHRTFVLRGQEFPAAKPNGLRLLWHYDVYVIACHPRNHLIPHEKERIFLRGAGPSPTLLVDGRVAGAWRRTHRGRRLEIAVEPFRRLTSFQQGLLREEADRVGRTYGAKAIVL